jgi:STE24 endopeptidase
VSADPHIAAAAQDESSGPVAQAPEAEPLSAAERVEARSYERAKVTGVLLEKAIDLAYLAAFALWAVEPLDAWLVGWLPRDTPRLAILVLVLTALHGLITLPLAWWSGYALEQRFGLSRQSLAHWGWQGCKRFALGAVLEVALLVGLYWVFWLAGAWWWLAAAAAFFLVSVVLSQLAPVVVLPLFYRVERLDDPELAARTARVAAGTGLAVEGVYRLALSDETAKANAALAGLGRTRRVLLGDTLLAEFTPDEIEVVLAHEIGHHVHRHIALMLLGGAAASAAGFWLTDRALAAWVAATGGSYDPQQLAPATLPVLLLTLGMLGTLAEPLAHAVSRRFERQADRYALQRTGMREAYVSAFRKLARLNKVNPQPHPLTVLLLHSHPPIAERLRMAGTD